METGRQHIPRTDSTIPSVGASDATASRSARTAGATARDLSRREPRKGYTPACTQRWDCGRRQRKAAATWDPVIPPAPGSGDRWNPDAAAWPPRCPRSIGAGTAFDGQELVLVCVHLRDTARRSTGPGTTHPKASRQLSHQAFGGRGICSHQRFIACTPPRDQAARCPTSTGCSRSAASFG